MTKKPTYDTQLNSKRRQLLKLAGASVAVGSLGLKVGLAHANTPTGDAGDVLDVAIIGAGLAGLTAARDLLQAGNPSFVVLEARDRVGGRTLNFDAGGGHISEVGGQWIGPGQTAIADLARQLDVGTFPSYYEGRSVIMAGDGRLEIDLEGTFGSDLPVASKLSEMSREVPSGAPWKSPRAAEWDKLSVGDWLTQQNVKPENRLGWDTTVTITGGVPVQKMGLLHYLSMINSASCQYGVLGIFPP